MTKKKIIDFFFKYERTILICAILIISIIYFIWAYKSGYIVVYADAASHLNIARRLFDNKTPGFAQLGSAWLPLFHILLFPFVINNFLYYSGIAGYLVNIIPFIMSNLLLFSLFKKWFTKNSFYPFFLTLLFALNPNILYMHTTAMEEIWLIFTMIASVYYLQIFLKNSDRLSYLILSSIFIFLSTINRYEGWFIALVSLPLVFITLVIKKNIKIAEATTILFGVVAFFGVGLWFLYNATIFGDPLSFLHSAYSTQGQQNALWQKGLLPTKGNVIYSLLIYVLAVISITGSLFVLVALLSLILSLSVKSFKDIKFWIACILLSPGIFEVYTLIKGITGIYVMELFPYKMFNTRYGLFVYPGMLLIIAYFFSKPGLKLAKFFLTCLLFFQIALLYTKLPITLIDPDTDLKQKSAQSQLTAANYLHTHYSGGNIIIAAGALDPVIFYSQIPIKEYIHEGNEKLWNESLSNPSPYAEFIVVSTNNSLQVVRDLLAQQIIKKPQLVSAYNVVYQQGVVTIYQRK